MPLIAAKTQQSFVEDQSETCCSQRGSQSLQCCDTVKHDHDSNQPESADCIVENVNNPDIPGNSTSEPANSDEQDSSLLHHWQLKYPGRKIEPHSCTTCGKQFLQGVQLRKHMIKHATAEDENEVEFPYTCYVCRRHFLFATDLRRHLISHSNDRPYVCVICTRPFKREDDLTKHLKTHGDVRPYKCDECSEWLQSTSKLRRHMRKAHGDRFECQRCRVFFAKRSLLSKHRREVHTGQCNSAALCVATVCLLVILTAGSSLCSTNVIIEVYK